MGRPPPLPLRLGSGPVPVESVGLEYAGWGVRVHSRPGVVVALGVVSIVVGVLGGAGVVVGVGVVGWGGGVWGVGAKVVAVVGARQLHAWSEPAPAVPQALGPAVALAPHLGDFVGERGLKAPQRQAVLAAV